MGKERKGFLQADVGPGMGKTHFALVTATERCEQGLHLDNSLPGSLRAMKSVGDGAPAHPDLSAGPAMGKVCSCLTTLKYLRLRAGMGQTGFMDRLDSGAGEMLKSAPGNCPFIC